MERLVALSDEGQFVPTPIDLGPATDQLAIVLFVTGLRGRSSLENVRVKIDGVDATVDYAGPQSEVAGLDQLNVRPPRSLAGRGAVPLEITVDGQTSNVVQVAFR